MTPLNTFEFLELLLIQYIYILVEKQVSNSSMNNFRSTKRFEVNNLFPLPFSLKRNNGKTVFSFVK